MRITAPIACAEEAIAAREIPAIAIIAHIILVPTTLRDLNQLAIVAGVLGGVITSVATSQCRLPAIEHWAEKVAVPADILPWVVLGVSTCHQVVRHALIEGDKLIVGAGVLRCKVACIAAAKRCDPVGDWAEEGAIVAIIL